MLHTLCVRGLQGGSSLGAERWPWLLLASEHKEADQVEVTSCTGGGQPMQEGPGPGQKTSPSAGKLCGDSAHGSDFRLW